MQDLQLIGVHEDGEHLLLSGADDARFRMPVDEALRAAIRRDRPHLGQPQIENEGGLRPRDVQAMIRAGASADETASRAGWSVEKVHRYEGPILAEREHVAGLARKARLRSRSGVSGGSAPTLSARVAERLKGRDVEVTDASWDSWRAEGGPWTVVLTFAAGGRQRQASWSFDLADRTVSAVDDEARWLSEEVQASKGPIPAPQQGSGSMRATAVYDVEAEGGLQPRARIDAQDDPLDLMTAMRKRSTARGRRKPGGHRAQAKAVSNVHAPGEDLSAHARPVADQADGPQASSADPNVHPVHDAPGAEHQPAQETATGLIDLPEENATEGPAEPDSANTSGHQGKPKGPARRQAPRESARKASRPSVPAWDEIMFGSRPGADRSSS